MPRVQVDDTDAGRRVVETRKNVDWKCVYREEEEKKKEGNRGRRKTRTKRVRVREPSVQHGPPYSF